MAIKCPKCSALIAAVPDELGLVTCEKCGTRLRSKQSVKVTVSGGANSSSPSLPRIDPKGANSSSPSLPRINPKDAAPADVDHVLARIDTPSPDATIRPGSIPRTPVSPAPAAGAVFDMLLTEIRAIKKTQEEILGLLRAQAPAPVPRPEIHASLDVLPPRSAPRAASRGTSLLVIDDDDATREETVGALRSAGRVKTAVDGHAALAAIGAEKPSAIVLELGLGGEMPGQELVNMIKATMEWVDIPIVIHTRLQLGDEEEAKHEHGADAIVSKSGGSAAKVADAISRLLAR